LEYQRDEQRYGYTGEEACSEGNNSSLQLLFQMEYP